MEISASFVYEMEFLSNGDEDVSPVTRREVTGKKEDQVLLTWSSFSTREKPPSFLSLERPIVLDCAQRHAVVSTGLDQDTDGWDADRSGEYPIEPGEYRPEITVTMGGVEIFLPRSVQFTLAGSSIAGGRYVHEGPGVWETMKQKLRDLVTLPDQTPDFALALSNPERPVRIHFLTHITMGGVDIYRL